MANRQFHRPETQGVRHTYLAVTILPQGTSAPLLGEGDPNGSFVSVARTGVGAYTLTTKDPYVALVGVQLEISATAQANWTVSCGAPTQNANSTWTIPFTHYNAGTATDITAGTGSIFAFVIMRNSAVKP